MGNNYSEQELAEFALGCARRQYTARRSRTAKQLKQSAEAQMYELIYFESQDCTHVVPVPADVAGLFSRTLRHSATR